MALYNSHTYFAGEPQNKELASSQFRAGYDGLLDCLILCYHTVISREFISPILSKLHSIQPHIQFFVILKPINCASQSRVLNSSCQHCIKMFTVRNNISRSTTSIYLFQYGDLSTPT